MRLIKQCSHCGKQFGGSSTSQTELPYDLTILLLGIFPKELKTGIHTNICIKMLIAALFTIVKRWKQPTCQPVDDWTNKMWYIHEMEYYSVIKTNEGLMPVMTWMNFGNMSTERRQIQKTTHCMTVFEISRIGKSIETERRLVVARVSRGRRSGE